MRWFRLYTDAMRHPKVIGLSDRDFRVWVNLLSIAADNDGLIPPVDVLKRLLNMRLDYLSTALKSLLKAGLIDPLTPLKEGLNEPLTPLKGLSKAALDDLSEVTFTPHNWNEKQYKSDTSTERVRKHREVKCNVSVTPPDTETDTETESIKKDIPSEYPKKSVLDPDPVVEKPVEEKPAAAKPGRKAKPAAEPMPELPEWINPAVWQDFAAMRTVKRAPLTAGAVRLIIRSLEDLKERGHPPTAVLEQSILKGWTDVYELKTQQRNNGHEGFKPNNSKHYQEIDGSTGEVRTIYPADSAFGKITSGNAYDRQVANAANMARDRIKARTREQVF